MTEQFDMAALERALSKKERGKKVEGEKKERKEKTALSAEKPAVENWPPDNSERRDCPVDGKDMMYLVSKTPKGKAYRCEQCSLLVTVET